MIYWANIILQYLGSTDDTFYMIVPRFFVNRNYRMSSSYRQGASDYISEKLGTMGLVLGLQSFMPTKFKQQV